MKKLNISLLAENQGGINCFQTGLATIGMMLFPGGVYLDDALGWGVRKGFTACWNS